MRSVELDGRRMDSRSIAWAYLKEALGLPAYFGSNLDALADCLGEMRDVSITLTYPHAMRNNLREYGDKIIRVFETEAQNRKDFFFRIVRSGG